MPRTAVSAQELTTLMKKFGFAENRRGSHTIMKHDKTGLVVTLPSTREIPKVYLRDIGSQLRNFKIPLGGEPERKRAEEIFGVRLSGDAD